MSIPDSIRRILHAIARRWRNAVTDWRWKLFLVRNRIPRNFVLGAWSMQPSDFYVIAKILNRLRSPHPTVVELGSGASTVIIAKILARKKKLFTIISIEGDASWLEETRKLLALHRAQEGVALHHAPYRDYGSYQWFDLQVVEKAMQGKVADLIIVDAPPGNLCELSRNPALRHLRQSIGTGTHILLHDAFRPDEEKIIHEWSKSFATTILHRTEKGIYEFAAVIRREPYCTTEVPSDL